MLKNAKIVSRGASQLDYFKEDFKRGDPKFTASSSMLRAFIVCASRWFKGYESPESKAKDFGTLLDCRILTPETFADRFAVAPSTYEATGMKCPSCGSVTDSKKCKACGELREEVTVKKDWNWNAGPCKEWLEGVEQGVEIVTTKEVGEVDAARRGMLADPIIASFLECSDRQVWLTAEWHDPDSGLVIPLRCLIDLVPRLGTEFEKCVGDLKAVRSGSIRPFKSQVDKMWWHLQAALYHDVYVLATGEDRTTHCFVCVENFEPYEPFRRMLSEKKMNLGRKAYTLALRRYCNCLKTGVWPSYDDHPDSIQGWTVVDADEWEEMALLSETMAFDQVQALKESEDETPEDDVPS